MSLEWVDVWLSLSVDRNGDGVLCCLKFCGCLGERCFGKGCLDVQYREENCAIAFYMQFFIRLSKIVNPNSLVLFILIYFYSIFNVTN